MADVVDDADSTAGAGHVLTNTRGTSLLGCGGLGLVVGIGGMSLLGNSAATLFPTIIVVIAAIALAVGIYEYRHWGPVTLTFEHWPLRLGESHPARLTREAKTRARNRSVEFTSELTCTEVVTYSQGTDTAREKEVVVRSNAVGSGEISDNVFSAPLRIDIPLDRGAPSLSLHHNEINWRIEVDLPKLSPFARRITFELSVGPEIDLRSNPMDIQDSVR